MIAARYGYLQVVDQLLSVGTNPNVADKYGRTALMYAIEDGHLNIVRLLVKAGANMNAQDKYGATAR